MNLVRRQLIVPGTVNRYTYNFLQVIVNEESAQATQEFLTKRLTAIKNQRSTGELEDLALIIGKRLRVDCHDFRFKHQYFILDGKSLGFALQKDMNKIFLELAIMCKAVICCKCCQYLPDA